MYEIKRLEDSTFHLNGYYISTDGVVRTILDKPFHFDSDAWKNSTGWRASSSDPSIFQFTDPATDMPTDAKITTYNDGRDHFVELTDKKGRFVRILTTDNDIVIVLVAIAAATCISAWILSMRYGKCQEVCGQGNVKEMHIGIEWKMKFIPTCGYTCKCKE